MGDMPGKQRNSGRASLNILICVFFVISMIAAVSRISVVNSTGGVYPNTEHGGTDANSNSVTGVTRPANNPSGYSTINTTDFPAGGCIHCHDEHSSYDTVTHTPEDYMIFDPGGADKNKFCYLCHTNPRATNANYTSSMQVWQGSAIYNASGHGTSASAYWPGPTPPAKPAADAGKCVNCHNQHGASYGSTGDNLTGQVTFNSTDPTRNMLTRSEENLCLVCHDGSPAASDIQSLLALGTNSTPVFYNHPINTNAAANDRSPSYHNIMESKNLYAVHVAGSPEQTGRHVECVDCHNPHYASAGTHTLGTNVASPVLYGAWGVTNSSAWPSGAAAGTLNNPPTWTPKIIDGSGGDDYEWQLCMRCHSDYSAIPTLGGAAWQALTNVAREINPNNLSHHAIVAPGNNQLGGANATVQATYDGSFTFANPRSATVYCSDCHTTAMGNAITALEGPHGSSSPFIVGSWCESRGGADFGTANCANALEITICYKCHKYGVYFGGAYSAGSYGSRSPVHDGTHQVTGARFGDSLYCLICHGGITAGGIHGTNDAPGARAGAEPSGKHFMNGGCLESFDYGAGGTSNITCWTESTTTTYCVSTCAGQHKTAGGKTAAPLYDYCDPTCPGT